MDLKLINKVAPLLALPHKILLAVSGGVDSVVLLAILYQYFIEKRYDTRQYLAIAHCNFRLRGQESDEDENFVESLSEKYQLPFFCKKFDTLAFATANQLSTQVAARQLRYTWFKEILQTHHFHYVATAHHLNDSLETVLYNLAKGTGIAGVRGILPQQNELIRPLLSFTKEEILEYATENQLVWREDSSNATDKYSRNLIRHQAIPILKQINPNLEHTFSDTLLRLSAVERVFQAEVEKFKGRVMKIDKNSSQNTIYYIDIEVIKQESEGLIKLYEVLKDFGFNFTQAQLIFNSFDSEAGKVFSTDTHILVRDRSNLVITTSKRAHLPQLQQQIFEKTPDFQHTNNSNIAYLDYERTGTAFSIRFWQEGDKFSPLGMKGKTKNVSDFLNDLKVPLNLKQQVSVLVCQEEIAWIIGYRISEKFKITDKTKIICELRMVT